MPKPITVDLLHPTIVRAFTNWGYISFFGCIAALITLLFFAIGQLKQADEAKDRRAVASVAASDNDDLTLYTNRELGFSIQYPHDAVPSLELNDQINRLTGFGRLPGKYFEVRLDQYPTQSDELLQTFLDGRVVSRDIKLGGVTGIEGVNPVGYVDGVGAGQRGTPFVDFAARHNGNVYRLIFYGDGDLSSEEAAIKSSFQFID